MMSDLTPKSDGHMMLISLNGAIPEMRKWRRREVKRRKNEGGRRIK